jgi:hypothetical protein
MALCPICNRPLIGVNEDRHHLIPKVKGGKKTEPVLLHIVCHRKLHSLWTEWELLHLYNNLDTILQNDDIQKFIKWIAKKPPEFIDSFRQANRRNENYK